MILYERIGRSEDKLSRAVPSLGRPTALEPIKEQEAVRPGPLMPGTGMGARPGCQRADHLLQ
jgi:hypothetical protein